MPYYGIRIVLPKNLLRQREIFEVDQVILKLEIPFQ